MDTLSQVFALWVIKHSIIITRSFGFSRQTVINKACMANSVVWRDCIEHLTTRRDNSRIIESFICLGYSNICHPNFMRRIDVELVIQRVVGDRGFTTIFAGVALITNLSLMPASLASLANPLYFFAR